ncbi:hypothetical protein CTAYLR_005705 [Chrysophaeum taylorii]|uniref:Sodium/bile acid cotransporter 7 n=1 Tax=Chrysophaeum taylorii TaxID=2483200 RepID=A0AAD7UBZ1_9STRA|nr:hypothetical protein CTAYLR_005705 [Chrysophaeum taylorii]
MRRCFRRHWFLTGVGVAIAVSRWAPWVGAVGGPLHPEITVKAAVGAIFFLSGLSLQPSQLNRAIRNFKLHALIQTTSFVLVPLAVMTAPCVALCEGTIAVACMPPPVSSAAILTRAAGGNDAAAIFNAAIGSVLGVFVTPLLLLKLVPAATAGTTNIAAVLCDLCVSVLCPLAVGQCARPFHARRLPLGTIGQATLLLIIYTTFCDAFARRESLEPSDLAKTALFLVLLQIFLMSLVFCLATRLFSLSPPDVVCALFSATHKSLTLGIPILRVVFSDNLPALSAPLLIYHPTQILLGGLLVTSLRSWLLSSPSSPRLINIV